MELAHVQVSIQFRHSFLLHDVFKEAENVTYILLITTDRHTTYDTCAIAMFLSILSLP